MPLTSSLSQLRSGTITQPSFTPGITQPSFATGGIPPPTMSGVKPPPPGINPPTGGFGGGQGGPLVPNNPFNSGQSAPLIPIVPPPNGGIIPPDFDPTGGGIKGQQPPPSGGAGGIKDQIGDANAQTGNFPGNQQQFFPQFGLAGAESARLQGANAASNAFQTGSNAGLNTLQGGFNQAGNFINQGVNALGGGFSATASNVDPLTGQPLFNQGAAQSGQFISGGAGAQQRAMALTGQLGQEAFDAARLDNPQQRFLEQRGRQALIDSQTSTGRVGSGQLQVELQKLGQAQAAQSLQQQIDNSRGLADQGIRAAGQSGQILAQGGAQQGRLAGQNAAQQTQASITSAGNRLNAARGKSQLFGQGAALTGQLAQAGAGLQQQTGRDIGQILSNTASQIGADRFTTGRDIAGNVQNTTQGLSNLQNQEGINLEQILSQFGANAGNLIQGAGNASGSQNAQLAALLANLASGQGSDLGGLALAGGQTNAGQALQGGQNNQQLINDLIAMFGQQGGG